MLSVLKLTLERIVSRGNLTVIDNAGKATKFGDGTGTPVTVRLTDRKAEWALVLNAQKHLGELYMDGRFVVEDGSIYDFLETALSNVESTTPPKWLYLAGNLRYLLRRVHQYNPMHRSRKNVAHHYDLNGELYDLFLDPDRQYSCAYFEDSDSSLEEAQLAKKRHIAAKLNLADGKSVLDIGSGWGGLGIYLAGCADLKVTGITLSTEQLKVSTERKEKRGLDRKVEFRLQDYRLVEETFDRVVSVGMFEHVGVGHYDEFFGRIAKILDRDGVALVHSIARSDGPGVTNAWIDKYIFPGGYIPSLSEVIPVVERQGLYITDIEILRLHYAETLRHWRQRFLANRAKAEEIYDERFCRMWEFYLAASETAFRYEGMNVFQMQICKNQHAIPITRDYMFEWECEKRRQDSGEQPIHRIAGE